MSHASTQTRAGIFYGLGAYAAWGVVPLYFYSVRQCPPKELLAHRILWSAVFLAIIITIFGRWQELFRILRSRLALWLALSAVLVSANWYVYVYSAMTGQVTQASLGYFILPLVNALVGVTVFRESIRPMQVIALLLAAGGMIFMVSSLQILPWISLYLAITFACYGFVRKVTPVDGIMGLTIETFLLSPIALCLLLIWNTQSPLVFGSADRALDVRIALSGLVTIIPLICFAQGIRRISLLTMGFLQYLSPTLQLICAVALLNETFTTAHWITFSFIWAGLLLFIIDSTVQWQKKKGAIRQQKLANELPPEPAKPASETPSARTKECLAGENCSL